MSPHAQIRPQLGKVNVGSVGGGLWCCWYAAKHNTQLLYINLRRIKISSSYRGFLQHGGAAGDHFGKRDPFCRRRPGVHPGEGQEGGLPEGPLAIQPGGPRQDPRPLLHLEESGKDSRRKISVSFSLRVKKCSKNTCNTLESQTFTCPNGLDFDAFINSLIRAGRYF